MCGFSPSDLNENGGGSYLYLIFTSYHDSPMGTYTEPNYGKTKTYSRAGASGSADGTYIAVVQNTIRQEKFAEGVASANCDCADITDDEVMARLYEMGAPHILDGPILTVGDNYSSFDTKNQNKVFIGHSRTNDSRSATKDILLYADPLMNGECKPSACNLLRSLFQATLSIGRWQRDL